MFNSVRQKHAPTEMCESARTLTGYSKRVARTEIEYVLRSPVRATRAGRLGDSDTRCVWVEKSRHSSCPYVQNGSCI